MKTINALIYSFLIFLTSCTWSGDEDSLGGKAFNVASTDASSEPASNQSWQDIKPERTLCPSTRATSRVIKWPRIEYIDHRSDSSPSNEYHLVDEPAHPSCVLGRHARIALVRIDAIVRDYMNPQTGTTNWTVYRLEVFQVYRGGELPQYIYAASVTGTCSWIDGNRQDCRSYPTALRSEGETGIALFDSLGYDPIYAQANLTEENAQKTVIPARVLSFGVFLPKKEGGFLDLSRESRPLERLIGEEASASELVGYISSIDDGVECPQQPSTCGNCSTAENCLGKSFNPPCRCINDWVGCDLLPIEDRQFCSIFEPVK
jgi:hypothetical protein